MRTDMSTAGLALLAGLIFPLGLSPLDFWPAIPVSAGALYAILNRDGLLTSWRIGLAYGIGFFGAGVSWVYVSVHVYGATPVWLAVLLTAIFCGGLALIFSLQSHLYSRFAGNQSGWRIVQFSSLWVLMEWLRTFLLTGFPWAFAGYGVLDSPLSGWIPVLGIYGCSWLLVGLGCLGAEILSGRHTPAFLLRAGAITTLAFVAAFGWQRTVWTQPTGEPLSVSAVQPNIPLAEKWDPRKRPQILADFDALSEQLYAESDLIVWPESALPGYRDQLQSTLQRVDESAKSLGKAVITGIPTRDHMGRYNSVAVLGAGQGTYHKQKLVPFGEYVPLETWLRGAIAFFDLPMSQFSAGPSDQQPLLVGDAITVAPFICYEVVYPDFVLAQSRQD
jgi:apolipoprotein N-acyltransferase